MANDDFPRGLIPLNTNNGGTVKVHYYQADTALDLFVGMLVKKAADGEVIPVDASAAREPAVGVITGFALGNANGQMRGNGIHEGDPFLDVSDLSGVTAYAAVADDPAQEFVIQEDSGGTALTQAAVGASLELVYRTTSGNTNTGYANLEADASTVAATTGGMIQFLRYHDILNTDGTSNGPGDFAKLVVRILHHQNAGGGTVAGVI